jgi:hypothetical protein
MLPISTIREHYNGNQCSVGHYGGALMPGSVEKHKKIARLSRDQVNDSCKLLNEVEGRGNDSKSSIKQYQITNKTQQGLDEPRED